MNIIINKENLIDSLFNLGLQPTQNDTDNDFSVSKKDSIMFKVAQPDPVEYFPFNPSFQTSDEIKKAT